VKKNSRLYFISLEEVIRIFNTAGNDYPAKLEITRCDDVEAIEIDGRKVKEKK